MERTLAFEVLPKLERQATSEWLVDLLREHLAETKEHAARLEQVFRAVGAETSSNLSAPIEKLAQHHDELAGSIKSERLADSFHAIAAATTEHYELAAYEALLAIGRTLDLGKARKLLEQNRDEDAQALRKLEDVMQRLLAAIPPGPPES